MTIGEAQQQLLFQLNHIYDDREAQTISDWVMEHVTGWQKIDRVLNRKAPLSVLQQKEMQSITYQLMEHKPVHYVLHHAWFHGMKLYVDENVLIPRPETEELVEWVVKELKRSNSRVSILDVGTGSGCIPIAIKKQYPAATVTACDISKGALEVAGRNARDQQTEITFIELNFLDNDAREKLGSFDVITSNPPYISESEKAQIDRHVEAYEPHTALFVPDDNSLVFYQHLAVFGKKHLNAGGYIVAEIHYMKGKEVKQVFESAGYATELRKDLQGNDRMVRASRQK